ncbi:MAG: hypothetical protein C4293_07930 [Nitrospiraceae bacterium]
MQQRSNGGLRVVCIIDRLNIGGPAKHVTWLTAGLSRKRFETVLITGTVPPGEGDMGYFADKAGVRPIVIKEMSRELGLRDLLVIGKLLRLFFALRPSVIHTHKAKAGAAGRVAALLYKWLTPSALFLRPRRCLLVHTFHGHIFHSYYGPFKTWIFLAVERLLARITDRIITVSERQRYEICERFRVGHPEQFQVIPLGLDFGTVRNDGPHLRAELSISREEILIGVVGRLCEVKNFPMFLHAAAHLAEQGLRARYVIIGDGHLRSELESLAARLGITDRVVFLGFRDDVMSLYSNLDIVSLTSLNEGTPLTLIEAMSCGRPVVSTEVGGVCDLMGRKQASFDGFSVWSHGLTVPSRDTAAFVRAVRYLSERPELRGEMGKRGSEFVRNNLSKERLVRDMETLYSGFFAEKVVQNSGYAGVDVH